MTKTRDLFKKRYQENISCKDGSDKDLTEIEEIKKRWQKYTEQYKKVLMTQITKMLWSLT